MENNTDLVQELEEIVAELKQDPHNSSSAFRLFEISEHLLRGFINDYEIDYEHHDADPTKDDEDPSGETDTDHTAAPAHEPKTLPYSVTNHTPSFSEMKKNINEWLEPVVEFESENEAIEYLKENVETGSVIKTDWESGHAEILFSITAE